MKMGIIGDAHLGCADYTERRRADFAQAFINAVESCLAEGVESLCLLGDVFDSALMRRNVEAFASTLKEVGPLFDRLRTERIPIFAIAGNHEFGRGREAAELSILEALGFLRVLRGEQTVIGGCAVVGFPWHSQDEIAALHPRVRGIPRGSISARRILLLHNFIKGSAFIPSHVGEVDSGIAEGFDRVFVGHHHDAEELGAFVMPGATEVQNLAEADSHKSVVIYDTSVDAVIFRKLPKTRDVIVLTYDVGEFTDRERLLSAISNSLAGRQLGNAFVCIRVKGQATQWSVSKAEVVALLRNFDIFDRYVEVRTTESVRTAVEAVAGASIDARLQQAFGAQAKKAHTYIDDCTNDGFPASIIDRILR